MDWKHIQKNVPKKIFEVIGAKDEPIDTYVERYTSEPPPYYEDKMQRYYDNVIGNMAYGSSLLVFGSGHPYTMNRLLSICPNIAKLGCVDFIPQAGEGLDPSITYYNLDILEDILPCGYDYIFSSHTLEHFTRDQLLDNVMPKMMLAAKKAVTAVVPYKEAWIDEPSHKCRFDEEDELAFLATAYKIMFDGQELALWIGSE